MNYFALFFIGVAMAAVTQPQAVDAIAAPLIKDGRASCAAPNVSSCGDTCSATNCGSFMINVHNGLVTNIYLVKNSLTALPTEIGVLTAVTNMHLYENKITAIPSEIGNLQALTGLLLFFL